MIRQKSHTARKRCIPMAHELVMVVWREFGLLLTSQTLFSFSNWGKKKNKTEKAAACIAMVKQRMSGVRASQIRMWYLGSSNLSGNLFQYKQTRLVSHECLPSDNAASVSLQKPYWKWFLAVHLKGFSWATRDSQQGHLIQLVTTSSISRIWNALDQKYLKFMLSKSLMFAYMRYWLWDSM